MAEKEAEVMALRAEAAAIKGNLNAALKSIQEGREGLDQVSF